MAFQKNKSKKMPRPLSKAEQAFAEEKLNVYKKFLRPVKGQIVLKREGSMQEVVKTARYFTEDDFQKDAKKSMEELNELDKTHRWQLLSWKVLSKSADGE